MDKKDVILSALRMVQKHSSQTGMNLTLGDMLHIVKQHLNAQNNNDNNMEKNNNNNNNNSNNNNNNNNKHNSINDQNVHVVYSAEPKGNPMMSPDQREKYMQYVQQQIKDGNCTLSIQYHWY